MEILCVLVTIIALVVVIILVVQAAQRGQPPQPLTPLASTGITTPELRDQLRGSSPRRIDQLVFVGLNGYALALDRKTGDIVWSNDQMKSGYVTLLVDDDRLIVSTNGYIYCLDPLTGRTVWHNPLRGYGAPGPTSLVSVRGQGSQTLIQQAAREEASNS